MRFFRDRENSELQVFRLKSLADGITEYRQRKGCAGFVLAAAAGLFLLFFCLTAQARTEDGYVFSQKEDSIYQTLRDNGYSVAGASGIMGNMAVENPTFEADLYANGGYTYGLFQWTNDGNRRDNLVRWCNNRVIYPNRIEGQMAFAIHELQGGDGIASRVNSFLQSATDPEKAAMEFAVGFERCIGSTGNREADGIYTGTIYPEHYGSTYQALSKRMEKARNYYEAYSMVPMKDDQALEIKITPTAGIVAEQEEVMEEKVREVLPLELTDSGEILAVLRILCLIVGYGFGNIQGVALMVRNVRKKDRSAMEALPGPVKALHYVGPGAAFLSVLLDVGKFFLALAVMYVVSQGALGSEQILWTGLGVIAGNDFPVINRFRGGMGLMVTTIFLCTYMPIWGCECCLLGLVVAVITRSFPFGAACITLFAVPYAFFCKGTEAGIFVSIALGLLLIRNYRFLVRFVGRDLLRKHYSRHRRTQRAKKKVKTEQGAGAGAAA